MRHQRLQEWRRWRKLPQLNLTHAGSQLSFRQQRRLRVLLRELSEANKRVAGFLLLEEQHTPVKARAADVVRSVHAHLAVFSA